MGISFYTCANCQRNFPDCGDYFNCFTCGEHFCNTKCADMQVEENLEDPDGEEDYEEITTCKMCRKESATDNQLLNFLLGHFKLTYEQAMELYRNGEQGNISGAS